MATGRFSHRVYVAFCTVREKYTPMGVNISIDCAVTLIQTPQCIVFFQVYCLGTILSMQISFVGFQPVQSSEHMAVSRTRNKLYFIVCKSNILN